MNRPTVPMPRDRKILTGLLALCAISCAGPAPLDDTDMDAALTFEEFRASLPEGAEEGTYIIDGGIRVWEDELRELYDRRYGDDASFRGYTVYDESAEEDQLLAVSEKLNLTYCVSDEFGDQHDRVVELMEEAASTWEVYADVNFVYRPQFDDECEWSSGDEEPFFRVRYDVDGEYPGSAFFPRDPIPERTMYLTYTGLDGPDEEVLGTFQHQLGHILGFRNEHIGVCAGGSEYGPGREITPFNIESVMWPQGHCGTDPAVPKRISRYDTLGVRYLYSLPTLNKKIPVFGADYTMLPDYNSDGATDVYWTNGDVFGDGLVSFGQNGATGFEDKAVQDNIQWTSARPFPGRFTTEYGISTDVMDYHHQQSIDRFLDTIGPDFELDVPDLQATPVNAFPIMGDFDGDLTTDILWYGPGDAPDELWLNKKEGREINDAISFNAYAWPVVGDYNGDYVDDIFWYLPVGGISYTWTANGSGTFSASSVDITSVGLSDAIDETPYRPLPGDFNGDGHGDIFWYRPGPDSDRIWYGRELPYDTSEPQTVNYLYRPIVADFNGSGRTDIFWYGQGSRPDRMWYFRARGGYTQRVHDISEDAAPFAGDFNGDGKADILWYQPDSDENTVWYSAGRSFDVTSTSTPLDHYPVGFGPGR